MFFVASGWLTFDAFVLQFSSVIDVGVGIFSTLCNVVLPFEVLRSTAMFVCFL